MDLYIKFFQTHTEARTVIVQCSSLIPLSKLNLDLMCNNFSEISEIPLEREAVQHTNNLDDAVRAQVKHKKQEISNGK